MLSEAERAAGAARAAEEASARTEGGGDVTGARQAAAAVSTEGMDDIDAMMAEMV